MKTAVLDHGYLEYVEHWGSDERIIEAARMSTNKGFQGWGQHNGNCSVCGVSQAEVLEGGSDNRFLFCHGGKKHSWTFVSGDEKLLRYLYEHKHATPFEMAGLIIEVQAPIMVFREWHRHRTQSYNEMSGRYTPLPNLNYIPTVERLMMNSKTNKQAGTVEGAKELTREQAQWWKQSIVQQYQSDQTFYEISLDNGVPKELARLVLPVGRYSRMRASANLRNWLAFLTLRMDESAQWEIRMYANAVGEIIAKLFPRTWSLFIEGKV